MRISDGSSDVCSSDLIYAPGNSYAIHVDKNSGPKFAADIADFLKPYQGVAIIESPKALWGGYSLVDAELRGMARLLAMNDTWTNYINLSGQAYPLNSLPSISHFLRTNPVPPYIRALYQHAVRQRPPK